MYITPTMINDVFLRQPMTGSSFPNRREKLEDFTVHRPVDDEGRDHAAVAQAGDEGGGLLVAMRDARALAAGRAPVTPGPKLGYGTLWRFFDRPGITLKKRQRMRARKNDPTS